MTVLAIAWVPLIVIPALVQLHGSVSQAVAIADYLLWALFAIEYGTKVWLASNRLQFVRTHKLELAMVAIPVLRPLRALRALRLTRAVATSGESAGRVRRLLTHKGLHWVLLTVLLMVLCAGALEVVFEAHVHSPRAIHNFGEAIWWAVVTVTTVGYGDRVPQTAAGEGVAIVLMLVGIALVGVLTATVASFFVSEDQVQLDEEVRIMRAQLDRMESLLSQMAGPSSAVVAAEGSLLHSLEASPGADPPPR